MAGLASGVARDVGGTPDPSGDQWARLTVGRLPGTTASVDTVVGTEYVPSTIMSNTLSSLADFWSHLTGPVHPRDEHYFRDRPDVAALLQKGFIPSAFFGDVVNARVILCYGNGGSEDDQEFYRDRAMQDALLEHIQNPGPVDPSRFFTYFHGEWHTPLIRDGQAVLVNAVAYRSVNMNALTDANMGNIPSVKVARDWIRTACAEAACGRRLVVFQRCRLWGVKRHTSPGVVFATNPVSKSLSKETRAVINDYLDRKC